MHWTCDRHTHNSGLKRGKFAALIATKYRAASTAIMNGKVESCSNNQDESDVNGYPKELSEVPDWRSRRNVSVCRQSGSLEPIALIVG
jgi:hypothetical protein